MGQLTVLLPPPAPPPAPAPLPSCSCCCSSVPSSSPVSPSPLHLPSPSLLAPTVLLPVGTFDTVGFLHWLRSDAIRAAHVFSDSGSRDLLATRCNTPANRRPPKKRRSLPAPLLLVPPGLGAPCLSASVPPHSGHPCKALARMGLWIASESSSERAPQRAPQRELLRESSSERAPLTGELAERSEEQSPEACPEDKSSEEQHTVPLSFLSHLTLRGPGSSPFDRWG